MVMIKCCHHKERMHSRESSLFPELKKLFSGLAHKHVCQGEEQSDAPSFLFGNLLVMESCVLLWYLP